jgi:hypothetical protein
MPSIKPGMDGQLSRQARIRMRRRIGASASSASTVGAPPGVIVMAMRRYRGCQIQLQQ